MLNRLILLRYGLKPQSLNLLRNSQNNQLTLDYISRRYLYSSITNNLKLASFEYDSKSKIENLPNKPPEVDPLTIKKLIDEDKIKDQLKSVSSTDDKVKTDTDAEKLLNRNNISNSEVVKKQSDKKWPPGLIPKISFGAKMFWMELKHYYYGFKLLFIDIRVCGKLVLGVMSGETLTRRERKQLVRTTADIFRIVPFIVFLAVPFLEFFIPIYAKMFPYMMPSTFSIKTSEDKEKEKQRSILKSKIELAKFLQDTLDESKSDKDIGLETFNSFMKQVREAGHTANTKDILKFSRLFKDEITLESLSHSQIKALCKILGINSAGPKTLLLFHLHLRVRKLKADDILIEREGIDTLPDYELITLCRERGMRAIGVSKARLKLQLTQWVNLSLHEHVPISLLLLSRTMYLPDALSPEEQLQQAILVLPSTVSKKAILQTQVEDGKDKYILTKTKMELIKEENQAIKEEKKEIDAVKKEEELKVKETLVDKAPIVTLEKETEKQKMKEKEIEIISPKDISEIESAISMIDKYETGFQEDIEDLKEHALSDAAISDAPKTRRKLEHKIESMITGIDTLLDNVTKKKDDYLMSEKQDKANTEKLIEITDLIDCLKQIRAKSLEKAAATGDELHDDKDKEEKWMKLLEILDEDRDGKIEVHHISELMDILQGSGSEMKLSTNEIESLLDAIDKEDNNVKNTVNPPIEGVSPEDKR